MNKYRGTSSIIAIMIACSSNSVFAQQAPTQTASVEEDVMLDEVVVTGSRIKRASNASSSVPLQVFNVGDLEEIGTDDLSEALEQLPGIGTGASNQSTNDNIQTGGLSTIALRRLGDNRTLVLINGKRAVSNSGNGDRVSLSTLPSGFVQRTEVTTGGASAVYGSDAIAGVANFVLRDDFEGLQLDGRYTAPEASGGEEYRINALYGTKFADDRGFIMLGATYRDEKMIVADATRPLSILAQEFDDPSTSSSDDFANERGVPGCDGPNTEKHCLLPSFDDDTPGGVFENGDAWFKDGQWFNDKTLNPGDRADGRDFFADFDGHRFREGRSLQGSREIFNVGLHASYELSSGIEASFTGLFSQIDSANNSGYETLDNGDSFGNPGQFTIGDIPSDNPFIPDAVRETLSGGVAFDRLTVELGEQSKINDRETIRLMGDLKGDFNDNYSWEVFGTFGHFSQKQTSINELNFLHAQQALNVEETSPGSGVYQCIDPAARANGCVPLNIFGTGSITPEMADYIRDELVATQTRTQYTLGGHVTGEIFDLPAGGVNAAFGFEYRREEQNTVGDSDGDRVGGNDGDPSTLDFNVSSGAIFPSLKANFDLYEVFAEVDVPLIADMLNFEAAVRFADYSTVGSVLSYNAGLVFQPTDDIRIRGQFSRSQRAPNITELFSPPRQDADDLVDTCDGLTFDQGTGLFDTSGIGQPKGDGGDAADLATIGANCTDTSSALNQGIHAWLADPDNAGEEFDGLGRVNGPNAGAAIVNGVRDLQEETANTYTVGIIYSPEFIPGLTVAADYYRIDIKDAIGALSTQNVVDLCYSSADFPNNKFCDVIERNSVNGDVIEVINHQENLNKKVVEGLDASLLYNFEAPSIPGDFDIDFRYTHYFKDTTEFEAIGGSIQKSTPLGELENQADEFRAKFGYGYEGFRFTYTVVYYGSTINLNTESQPTDDRYFKYDSQFFHRIYASYTFGDDDQYKVYAGVNNLTDNFGPFTPTGLKNGSTRNLVSNVNDAVGREFYLGARLNF